ncbi:MAG: DUF423 domain-containing protein [Micropepsaceae bacterium]
MLLILAGIAGFTGVAMGAFGAHALRDHLTPEAAAIYQTGTLYHLIHAVALLGAALLAREEASARLALWAGYAFAIGIVIFSGSLYVLAISGIKWLGAITPIGGVAFLAGWILIVATGWRPAA